MRSNKLVLGVVFGLVFILVDARFAVAQTTAPTGSGTIGTGTWRTPRNEVASVGSRTPGSWVARGIANAQTRQSTILEDLGGATPTPADQVPPSRRALLLNAALEELFDSLIAAVEQFNIALRAGQLPNLFTST